MSASSASSRTHSDDGDATNAGARSQPLPRNGSYDWIRTANDNHSRSERRSLAKETTEAVDRGWYWHASEQIPLIGADAAETSTAVISPSCGTWPSLEALSRGAAGTEVIANNEGTVLSLAMRLTEQGREVAAVSAASSHQVGGGFAVGGRHALEEAICVQSTLYRCLRHAWRQTGVPEGTAYIPRDGAIVSPQVEVFREGTAEGYATLPKPVQLACVVSVSMPNLNPKVRDAPVEKPASPDAYRTSLASRWRAVLRAASSTGATDVVCPDVGCGVYGNEPCIVGTALGEVLRSEFWGHIKTLWLLGSNEFCSAVEAGVVSASKSPLESPVREQSNYVKLLELKGKLLERMPMMGAGKATGSRSGASTPTASEKRSKSDKLAAKVRSHDSQEDTADQASEYNSERLGTEPKPELPAQSKSWVSFSGLKRKTPGWNKGSSMSTTASMSSSECASEGENPLMEDVKDDSQAENTRLTSKVGNTSAPLTDESLKRHLEFLLCCVPEEHDDGTVFRPCLHVNPGRLMQPDTVIIVTSGYTLSAGTVNSSEHSVVIPKVDAEVLRAEFERLSLCSDSVVVRM